MTRIIVSEDGTHVTVSSRGVKGEKGDPGPAGVPSVTSGNLLPLNVADGSESGTVTGIAWRTSFASVSSVANATVQGSRALKVERLLGTSGNPFVVVGSATTGAVASPAAVTAATPVIGGQPYTLAATVWSDTGFAHTVGLEIFWRLANGTTAASVGSVASAAQPSTTTTPTVRTVTGTAPLDAVLCFGRIGRNTNSVEAAGTYFYCDAITLHRGAGGIAALPGIPITGLGNRTNPDNTAQVQMWNGHTATWVTV